MSLDDLETVRAWRNHDKVRLASFSTARVDAEEHRAWFDRISADPAREVLVALDDGGRLFGVVQFDNPREEGLATWGFYVDPFGERGLGRRLGGLAIAHAFEDRGWHRIEGRVRAGNIVSERFHRSLGFREEGRLRQAHKTLHGHEDVLIFGLLAHERHQKPRGHGNDEHHD